jgi:hypothetical protein
VLSYQDLVHGITAISHLVKGKDFFEKYVNLTIFSTII